MTLKGKQSCYYLMRAERYLSGTQGTTLYSCINQDSFNYQKNSLRVRLGKIRAWCTKASETRAGLLPGLLSFCVCMQTTFSHKQADFYLARNVIVVALTSSLLYLPLILFQKVPETASDSPRVGVVILGSSNFHEIHPVTAGRDQAQRRGRRSFSGLTKQIIRQGCD